MEISYDPNKNQRNIEERGLPFDNVEDFDFPTALIMEDTRYNYPKRHPRYQPTQSQCQRKETL